MKLYLQHMLTSAGCEYTGARGYSCSLPSCNNRELTEIVCDKCIQVFCLRSVTAVSLSLMYNAVELFLFLWVLHRTNILNF